VKKNMAASGLLVVDDGSRGFLHGSGPRHMRAEAQSGSMVNDAQRWRVEAAEMRSTWSSSMAKGGDARWGSFPRHWLRAEGGVHCTTPSCLRRR
jgi:hypothetical protein